MEAFTVVFKRSRGAKRGREKIGGNGGNRLLLFAWWKWNSSHSLFLIHLQGFCTPGIWQSTRITRCCSNPTPSRDSNNSSTPQFLKFAVSGVTELLRLLSPAASAPRLGTVGDDEKIEILVSGVDDVLDIIKSDYEKAYFLTGIFTSEIYADDCLFEDPTIKFRGTELYARNLQLLVPFFDQPSIVLRQIEKGINSKSNFVLAKWQLRTYLKLPWKPLISIDGNTVYDLDDQFKIVRHAESWNVSALEAVAQIFRSSD